MTRQFMLDEASLAQDNVAQWDKCKEIIEQAWANRELLINRKKEIKLAIDQVIESLNQGLIQVVVCDESGAWQVQEWLKKAILLYFAVNGASMGYAGFPLCFDKVPLKFADWQEEDFKTSGIRAVPGSIVRTGTFIDRGVVLMPSLVNIGAYVGENTMVDTWATIGSCAYVGKNCHISGGVGVGGCIEPIQGKPVIIEDNCFIGGRCQLAEGVHIGKGSVLATGVNLTASTAVICKETGKKIYGFVPPFSVVVSGNYKKEVQHGIDLSYNCAVIVKTVDERTRSKVSLNELLRS